MEPKPWERRKSGSSTTDAGHDGRHRRASKRVSDATTDVSCKSCCAKKRETCDGDELSLLWIYGIVVAVFICVALTTCVFCVETRRRRTSGGAVTRASCA